MSHVEEEGTPQEQVDYVPDSKKDGSGDTEPEPKITCKKCIHKDVCYFLTRLCDEDAQMKQSGITRLPFSPYMLMSLRLVKH